MSRKLTIPRKPINGSKKSALDEWVESRSLIKAPCATKRMTLDVPVDLHKRIKAQCAIYGESIRSKIISILEREFP